MSPSRTLPLTALGLRAQGGQDAEISGLSVDSRLVKPGHLFAALPGSEVHGGEFIQYALRMDAAAILTDPEGARIAADELAASDAALIVTQDPRAALAYAAALWFGAQPEAMVAVTGTNGKTSVATFTRQIWMELGLQAANLGTTGVEGAYTAPSRHTTPEPITLHRLLADMAQAGITHAAMEASSHGLDQRRLEGVHLAAAGFTNFTQDHLDYHATFEDYFNAKARLFNRVLPDDGVAVINVDDPRGRELEEIAQARGQEVISIGRTEDCTLQLTSQRYHTTGQQIRFLYNGRPQTAQLDLIGGFQAENVLVAAGLAIASGCEPEEVFSTFPALTTVRGRMQLAARRDNGAAIFVDYAHTPDAISKALEALRPHVLGKLVIVFGAGGDRDTTKRPLMGRAAADFADVAIVTDDNPRTEDAASIRAMVREGCPEANEYGDRAEAILRGVDMLEPGDALLIAGKGHETGQIVGDDVLPFDDVEQASVAVAALEGRLA
ncbi:UDP-N-acetylmuramoyl-L-alanyl-D-glutamate--2,6-diaminopimelate ligase [Maritimibacter sp. UBA3975]|uniref:UDP-N-acetylmuramoyl-L-alanyl-D-glutamate--2, 6-diaminopimelate ligase n=1 Tax=Maritimibacter sp. UBA3975 TaxID=1946833 RepID=UPI000C09A826|nr:UDP-N-acetylmuramoyl-L-alanyl-D-glutamate--2,6-diaminopimelate ligase [Maritimibacter sp. UBA3975]MAM61613.1 UDP-N-acetylmuramoyl-L-alanyl-D-glutamate--2,6-diaminopimelate ligase [Maritimibacter sp.]|tara:strand:- start:12590 stop:14077 length:1488 start_codon:yes stop_codon:yes gene_type:complete